MKLGEFRNPTIRVRLEQASKTWLAADPKRSFREPGNISIAQIIKGGLLRLLLGLILFALWFNDEEGRLFLAVLLPATAIWTFLRIATIQASATSHEAVHLLPFDNQILTRQVRAELKRAITKGFLIAAILGAFGSQIDISMTGALQGSLIFLALLGSLTIAYVWRFFELLTLLVKGSLALLFAGIVMNRLKGMSRSLLEATPWFQAFDSPLILVTLLAVGGTIAWLTKDRWSKVARFNRTTFYENSGSTDPEMEIDSESGGMLIYETDLTPLPKHPTGLLERFIWQRLTTKEKALLRGIRAHTSNFLASWTKMTIIFLTVLWLTRFEWPSPITNLRPVAPLLAIVISTIATGLWTSPPTQYLNALILGPQTTVARFQAIPITLSGLEKLMWKEGFLRWFLFALTLAAAPLIRHPSEASFQIFCFYLLIALVLLLHVIWLHFWNASINGWTPRGGRGRGWTLIIEITITLGILITIVCMIPLLTFFPMPVNFQIPSGIWILVVVIIIYQIILRALVRAFISDNHADLIRQA